MRNEQNNQSGKLARKLSGVLVAGSIWIASLVMSTTQAHAAETFPTCNPGAPSMSIADGWVAEGDVAAVKITLSKPACTYVTVDVQTQDGDAKAGSDYSAAKGKVTFKPGETSKTVWFWTIDDNVEENLYEYFWAKLSNASGATIADAWSTVWISDVG